MKFKRILSVILCVALSISGAALFSGCGDTKSAGGTLVWYMFGDRPADIDTVLAKANEIIEPELGVKLDMQYIDQASYTSKMKMMMAAHDVYDLAFTGYVNNYQEAVSLGGLYDITDLIDEVGLNEIIPEFYLESATVDGKIYGIPNIQVASNPLCLIMDKSLAEEIGVDLDALSTAARTAKTMEEVEDYAARLDELFEKVHAARPNQYTMNPSYDLILTPFYEQVLSELYIRRDGSTDTIQIDMETPEGQLSAQKLSEWYSKGYIRPDVASAGTATTSNEEKRQFAVRSGTWKPGQEALDEVVYGQEQVYVMLEDPYMDRQAPLVTMTSVGADSKNPKKAVEFLKLINSNKELYNIICWGVEGTHYTLDEQGHVAEIEDSGYNNMGSGAWRFGNQFNALLMDGQEEGVWEETEKMNNDSVKSPMLGFVPNTDKVTNELANITNVADEYKAKREFGTVEVTQWQTQYEQKLQQAGIEKLRDEIQEQYDKFRSEQ